jgi:hypothetical protein
MTITLSVTTIVPYRCKTKTKVGRLSHKALVIIHLFCCGFATKEEGLRGLKMAGYANSA